MRFEKNFLWIVCLFIWTFLLLNKCSEEDTPERKQVKIGGVLVVGEKE